MGLKVLWICGCNSMSIDGMQRKYKKVLDNNYVTHIVDYWEVEKEKINFKEFDKIIYDDSYSACSCAKDFRTSYYLKFSIRNIKHELKVILDD